MLNSVCYVILYSINNDLKLVIPGPYLIHFYRFFRFKKHFQQRDNSRKGEKTKNRSEQVEQQAQEYIFFIRRNKPLEKCDELNEEDLEKVAGGILHTAAVMGVLGLQAVSIIGNPISNELSSKAW